MAFPSPLPDYQIDLIILGIRGLSHVKRFLFGSTSEWVMRDSSCSVLLVLGMKVDTVLSKGDPADGIIKTAERLKAKLLLVGSKGFKWASQFHWEGWSERNPVMPHARYRSFAPGERKKRTR